MLSDGKVLLLSISRANRFKNCARSFYYRYVLGIEETESYEAALGSFFHNILDFWAQFFLESSDLRESMRVAYITAKQEREQKNGKRPLLKEDLQIIKQWLKDYVYFLEESKLPIVLDHEKEFKFLVDNKYLVRGAIDRIDEIDKDTIRIVDYKAGSSRFVNSKQVSIYAKALIDNPIYKGKKFIGTYIFVKENCKVVEYEITNKLINNVLTYLKKTGEKIIIESNWKPTFSPLCGWCSYKFRCAQDNNRLGVLQC